MVHLQHAWECETDHFDHVIKITNCLGVAGLSSDQVGVQLQPATWSLGRYFCRISPRGLRRFPCRGWFAKREFP